MAFEDYMSTKISKLRNQFQDEAGSTKKRGIFSGIAIFVNGYTEPTGEELKQIMIANGGTYHHYFSRTQTTHIIASNIPISKIQSLKMDIVVNPKWIVDSLNAGKLLDYRNYLLYCNQILNQQKLNFGKIKGKDILIDDSPDLGSNVDDSVAISKLPGNSSTLTTKQEQPISNELLTENKITGPQNTITDLSNNSKKDLPSSANPNFLTDFYSKSRLHHLSTAGSMFKQYVKDLQSREDDFHGRSYLKNWMEQHQIPKTDSDILSPSNSRVIMHIDMDCFFVSVGLTKHPHLMNQPIAVTHASRNSLPARNKKSFYKEMAHFTKCSMEPSEDEDQHTVDKSNSLSSDLPLSEHEREPNKLPVIDEKCSFSEIASCNYEARKRGVQNGMFLGVALKLCPELKTIPYDFEGYKAVSSALYDIVASYTKDIEAVSCDEMYVDLADVLKDCCVSPLDFASCIRQQIKDMTQCCSSVGIGPNMLMARMATKRAKPNGQFIIDASQVQTFMQSVNVSSLPGVGESLRRRLADEGVKNCGDLEHVSLSRLKLIFGERTGLFLFNSCRGFDDRPVNKDHQRKSVSAEVNYGIRFEDWDDAETFVSKLSEEVMNRLSKLSLKGRTLTLKLKVRSKDAPLQTAKYMGHGICDNLAKSVTLLSATADKQVIKRETFLLLKQMITCPKDVRGVGIQVTKLESASSAPTTIDKYLLNKNISSSSKQCPNEVDRDQTLMKPSVDSESSDDSNGAWKESRRKAKRKSDLQGRAMSEEWAKGKRNPSSHTKLHPVSENCSLQMFKNPGQAIDLKVLNELPFELRNDVLNEYKALDYVVSTLSQEASHSISQPGPSRSSSFDPELRTETPNSLSHVKNLGSSAVDVEKDITVVKEAINMSFSEIDPNFLKALPKDVREEMEEDLKNKKYKKPRSNHEILGATAQYVSRKPVQPNIPKKDFSIRPAFSKKEVLQLQERLPIFEINASFEQPSLCREYQLDSIKALISQWIHTCPTPNDVDVQILADFCISLMEVKDLEKLELVLKCLNRRSYYVSQKWREGFNTILKKVQAAMMKQYKAPLCFLPVTKCNTSFSNAPLI